MAHKDYGEICPIFNEGVEKEMIIPLHGSITITDCMQFAVPWGREGTITEIYYNSYQSAGCSTSVSCTIGLYFDESMSTQFGSVDNGTAAVMSCSAGMVPVAASLTTSLNFTSTDYLGIAFITAVSSMRYPTFQNMVVRYKDK